MRRKLKILVLLAAVLLCAGCRDTLSDKGEAELQQQATQQQSTEPQLAQQQVAEQWSTEPQWEEQQSAQQQPAQQESIQQQTQEQAAAGEDSTAGFYYAYTTLQSSEERQLYQEILSSLREREKDTELSTLETELLEPVFHAVMADHPEIFYADGYETTTYTLGEALVKITFSGTYTMQEEEILRRSALLTEAADAFSAGLTEQMEDYEIVKYLYDYLVTHTEYKEGAPDSQNICSVLLHAASVCQGYAKTLQYLCQRAGIPAVLVTGRVDGQGHAWNLLMLDQEWYHVDPTWGDAVYLQQEDAAVTREAFPTVNYDYFCVTTEQIARTHEIDSTFVLPVCTATKDNYYRREGLYLETADLEQIAAVFDRAKKLRQENVTFMCADDAVYEEVYRLLITEQKIFDCLPKGETKAVYTDSASQRTFSFWLTQISDSY